jgi:spore germination protein PA
MFDMPAIVGAFKVNAVGTSSIVHIGDVITISPYSEVKTFAGAGSFNTGDGLKIYNQNSVTNTYDNNAIDQPIAGNA